MSETRPVTLEEYVQETSERMRADGSSVSVDIKEGGQTYCYTGRLVLGAIYTSWLRERLRVTVPSPSERTAPIDVRDGPPNDLQI